MPILASLQKAPAARPAANVDGRRRRGLTIGGGRIGVIACPCFGRKRRQIMQVAAARERGRRHGAFLREGPSTATSPLRLQGMNEAGSNFLRGAAPAHGPGWCTRIHDPHHVELVSRFADCLQIGARNMS